MNTEEDFYKQIHPVKYFRDYLQHEIRPDGRGLLGTRPLQINVESINTSDGSAVVKLGNTLVVCGIKAELAQPTATEPDQGFFVPNVELTPLCSSKYRPGAPSEDSQVCSRILSNIIQNSGCIDLKEFCIIREKIVWTLYCDIVCFNHDGCVLDAAVIATIAALKSVKLPKVEYNADTETCNIVETSKKHLTINNYPVSTSFMIFDQQIIVDPTYEEEKLAVCFITISVCNSELSYLYKPGGAPIDAETLEKCVKQAVNREKHVFELLRNVLEK